MKLSERSLQKTYLMASASVSPNTELSNLMLSYSQSGRSPHRVNEYYSLKRVW